MTNNANKRRLRLSRAPYGAAPVSPSQGTRGAVPALCALRSGPARGQSGGRLPTGPHGAGGSRPPAATGPRHTCCPLSCGRWPASRRAPWPRARLSGSWRPRTRALQLWGPSRRPVPGDNQRRQRRRPPRAPGRPAGRRPTPSALHLTGRPGQGLGGVSDARLGHGGHVACSHSPSPSHGGLRLGRAYRRGRGNLPGSPPGA